MTDEIRQQLEQIENEQRSMHDAFMKIVRAHPFIAPGEADAISNHTKRQVEIAEGVGRIKQQIGMP